MSRIEELMIHKDKLLRLSTFDANKHIHIGKLSFVEGPTYYYNKTKLPTSTRVF